MISPLLPSCWDFSFVLGCDISLQSHSNTRSCPLQGLPSCCSFSDLEHRVSIIQQHKRRLHTWTSPDGQYWNQIDYILCSQRWRSSVQAAKTKLGADSGSDHELIAKFRLKLKKVGKTTRSFRYELNQISYDYTVETTNTSKGFSLIKRVPEELWTEVHDIVQEAVIKTIPRKINEKKKIKMVVWGLTKSCEKKTSKRQRRKGRIYPSECRVSKNSEERQKAFLSDLCKEIEENNAMR